MKNKLKNVPFPTMDKYIGGIDPYEKPEKPFIVPVPSKVIWNNNEWIITNNYNEYTLLPCHKSTNNGETIFLDLDTKFGAYYPISAEYTTTNINKVDKLTLDFRGNDDNGFTDVTVYEDSVLIEQEGGSVKIEANMANAIAEFILNAKIPK